MFSFIAKLWQCVFCWRVRGLPEWHEDAEVVCACTFGRGDDSCNKAIADHVLAVAKEHRLFYCVQGEVGKHIHGWQGFSSEESSDFHGRGYVGTHQTVKEHVAYLTGRGATKIHLEAHPHHAWRTVMCYRKLGIQVVSLCVKDKPYPSKSTQKWCRSAILFIPYEIVARLLYLWKGYI